jgi:hypothetical protein
MDLNTAQRISLCGCADVYIARFSRGTGNGKNHANAAFVNVCNSTGFTFSIFVWYRQALTSPAVHRAEMASALCSLHRLSDLC